MRYVRIIIIAAALLALAAGAVLGQSGADLFQQALTKERAQGKLPEAIKLYQTIVEKYGSDRKLAAKALLQMAQAHQKLGNAEAGKTYEQILRNYASDQPEIAAEARRRLDGMATARVGDTLQPRLIPLTGIDPHESGLGFDGRSLAMIDWDTSDGDIAIRDMTTGQVQRLMARTSEDSRESGLWATLSPQSNKVAYFWGAGVDGGDLELRLTASEPGSPFKTLFKVNAEVDYLDAGAWFPDGQSLLLMLGRSDRTWQLARISIPDGKLQPLKSLEWRWRGDRPSISPDGKYIAYSALAVNPANVWKPLVSVPASESPNQYIYVLPADGSGPETTLVDIAGTNHSSVWADGSHIVFVHEQAGTQGLWSVEVRNGKAARPPSVVLKDTGQITPLGMTRAGSYLYVKEDDGDQIFTIGFEPTTKTIRGTAARFSEKPSAFNCAPAWSPDGKHIAFWRSGANDSELVIRSTAGKEEKVLARNRLSYDVLGCARPPVWSHDSKSLLTYFADPSIGVFPVRLDITNGRSRSLESEIHATLPSDSSLVLAPDGQTLYVARIDAKSRTLHIDGVELATGQRREIWISPPQTDPRQFPPAMAVSPDGSALAVILFKQPNEGTLIRVSTAGSGHKELLSGVPIRRNGLAWTQDGSALLFLAPKSANQILGFQVMWISTEGGKPEFTGLTTKNDYPITISPDGFTLAFTNGAPSQLWTIDNLSSFWRTAR